MAAPSGIIIEDFCMFSSSEFIDSCRLIPSNNTLLILASSLTVFEGHQRTSYVQGFK